MPARRVRCVLASVLAVGAVALLPATASAHPEECANTAAILSATSSDWFADWSAERNACLPEAVARNLDDSAAQLTSSDDAEGTDNLELVFNQPKAPPFETEGDLNSDLAFEDGYAYQGNYDGFLIWDVRRPQRPKLVSQVHCPGSQNDVTINDGILVTSTDSIRNKAECEGNTSVPTSSPEYGQPTNWEGLRVFDVRNPRNPRYVTAVRTDCGSHTHTVLPERDRLIIYVQSYDLAARKYRCDGAVDPHDKISIVEVPKSNPAAARVVNDPVLFPDGGYNNPNGSPPGRNTTGCHDITVYQELDLAAGACVSEGILMDISDPVNPEVISNVTNPTFAFWHSATISDDGRKVLYTDELGGGSQARCTASEGPTRGADAIYDITDRANQRFLSYWKIPRIQTAVENCVAHNGNLIPNMQDRDILVQSWYQGGVSVIDWTDASNVRELAWFDRGPFNESRLVLGGLWSTYFYNGYIFGSEIQRGFDVYKLDGFGRGFKSDTMNPQTQFPLGKPGWGNAKKSR